eukprot:3307784-Pleurochrysis_carterae.AAC.1
MRAKFIAQEQDSLQQDAFQQTVSLDMKHGALEKGSVVYTSSFSQERLYLAHIPPLASHGGGTRVY